MYLGIDTGGSKTAFSVIDENRNVIMKIRGKGIGRASDCDELDIDLYDMLKKTEKYNVVRVCVNLGGINIKQIEKTIKSIFPEAEVEIYRESSGTLPLYIADKNNADIVLLAGTGTIAIGGSGERKCICGGWGCEIGDEGSGYWIGKQAVIRSLKSLDSAEKDTVLTKKLLNTEKKVTAKADTKAIMEFRDEVRKGILPVERRKYASYTKIAAECAAQGDKVCKEIFVEAGRHMATLVAGMARKLELGTKINTIVMGGLVQCRKLWLEGFENCMKENKYECSLQFIEDDLSEEAANMAAERKN